MIVPSRASPRQIRATGLLALLWALESPGGLSPSPPPLASPRIGEILFEGAGRVPPGRLEELSGLRPGVVLSEGTLARGLRKLLAWNRVRTVVAVETRPLSRGSVSVRIALELRSVVRSLRLEGPRLLSRSWLLEGLDLGPGTLLQDGDLERVRQHVLGRYHERGHAFAAVGVRTDPAEGIPGQVDVIVSVEEGRRATIRSIRFGGNDSVPDRRLAALLHHRPRLLWGVLAEGFYEPGRIEDDRRRIREHYLRRGHLDARVAFDGVDITAGGRELDLGFLVVEGPRYTLRDVRIEGNNPALGPALERRLESQTGEPYNGLEIERDRFRLVQFYQHRTFREPRINVRHLAHFDTDPPSVTVVFEIDEEAHLFAGRVEFRGNAFTRDRVLRSAIDQRPLEPLTSSRLGELEDDLLALGYLENAEAKTSFAPDRISPFAGTAAEDRLAEPGVVRDVTIDVEERRTGLFELGGGASTGRGEIFTVRATQTNFDIFDFPGGDRGWERPFSGGGQTVRLEVNPGTRISEIRLLFVEPYLYSSRNRLALEGASSIFRWREFDEIWIGGEIGMSRTWDPGRHLSSELAWVVRDVEIDDADARAPAEIRSLEGHTLFSYPSLRIRYDDTVTDWFSGPRGLSASARVDLADEILGADSGFLRTSAGLDLHLAANRTLNRWLPGEPLSEGIPALDHVMRLGARLGWLEGLGGEAVPFFERFMLGGPESFRGFNYRRVGPQENGVPLGGEAFWTATIQYSLPVVLPEIRVFGVFDVGDIERNFRALAADRIRTAAGGGLALRLRFLGQALPVNLYWVEALRKQPGDRDRLFTFSLGLTF